MPAAYRGVAMEATARRMWRLLEPLHAVVYFADEAISQLRSAGLRGFWMGYFAGRSSPMGAVSPAVVEATFFNFAPVMVRRALPDAWGFAPPPAVLEARQAGATAALERILAGVDRAGLRRGALLAAAALEGLAVDGRPLAAANLALELPDDAVAALWQAATTLREHRGDGHVAALVDAELTGCEAHVSAAAAGGPRRAVLQPARGWTDEEWEQAEIRLRRRGLVDSRGSTTADGAALRARVEAATDRLAARPWARLGEQRTDELARLLEPLAAAVWASGVVPPENPIGLPAP